MAALLPDRHPNKDFFVLDVKEAAAKDEMASMEHPLYSLSVKPDMRELEYEHKGTRIRIIPTARGLATIMDKDVLLYAISKLTHAKNGGSLPQEPLDPSKPLSSEHNAARWVEMTAHEVMVGCNWNTGKREYQRFQDALIRLRGTTIETNIRTGDSKPQKGFGLIDSYEIHRVDEDGEIGVFGRMSKVRIQLSEFTYRAIHADEVLSINPLYFRLRRPIERRIYEIARKHCGSQASWSIGLGLLQKKVGSSGPIKKFRFLVREMITNGHVPDYTMELANDLVTFRSKAPAPVRLVLQEKTLEIARKMCRDKGRDFHAVESDWRSYAQRSGKPLNPDAAFIGYIKKLKSLRNQGSLF